MPASSHIITTRTTDRTTKQDPELVLAALRTHAERVEEHAGAWVAGQSQEQLDLVRVGPS